MNKDENILEQLSAYLDGELSPEQVAELERRLAGDAELARSLAELRGIKESVRSLPRAKVSDDFVSRVLQSAERGHLVKAHSVRPERSRRREWVGHLAAAAIALVALGVGVSVLVTIYSASRIPSTPIAMEKAAERNIPCEVDKSRPEIAAEGIVASSVLRSEAMARVAEPDLEIVVPTDNLFAMGKDLESTLISNGIAPVAEAQKRQRPGIGAQAADSFSIAQADGQKLVYEVVVGTEQATKLALVLEDFRASNSSRYLDQQEVARGGGSGYLLNEKRKEMPIRGLGEKLVDKPDMQIENRFAPPTTQLASGSPAAAAKSASYSKRSLSDKQGLGLTGGKGNVPQTMPAQGSQAQSSSAQEAHRQVNRLQVTLQYVARADRTAPAATDGALPATSPATAPAQ